MDIENKQWQPKTATKNGNEPQLFLNGDLRFNLRQRSVPQKPTIIYAVVRFGGKKHVLNTNAKVYPEQWSRKRQQAVISNEFTALDNRNNTIANDRIKAIRTAYSDTLNEINDDPDRICNFIANFVLKFNTKAMAKKAMKFTVELNNLNVNDSTSETTRQLTDAGLKHFEKFIEKTKLANDPSCVTYQNWESFKCYLESLKMKRGGKPYASSTIKEYTQALIRLFALYNKKHIDVVIDVNTLEPYKAKAKTTKNDKDKKHHIVTINEIDELFAITLPIANQQTAKNLFLFQCCVGCRVSDLGKIIRGEFSVKECDGVTYINYRSKKTDTDTYTPLASKTAKDLFAWVQTLKQMPFTTAGYNDLIKGAFKAIGGKYSELVTITESRGGKIVSTTKPLWEFMHNHEARHSFVTNMYYAGIPKELLITMSGHSNTKLIDEVYKQKDVDKELAMATKALKSANLIQNDPIKEYAQKHGIDMTTLHNSTKAVLGYSAECGLPLPEDIQ